MKPWKDKGGLQPHDHYPEMERAYFVTGTRYTDHPKWRGHSGRGLTLAEACEFAAVLKEDHPNDWVDVRMDLNALRAAEATHGIKWIPPIHRLLPSERRRYYGTTQLPKDFVPIWELERQLEARQARHSGCVILSALPMLAGAFAGSAAIAAFGVVASAALFIALSIDGERDHRTNELQRQIDERNRSDSWLVEPRRAGIPESQEHAA